MPWRLIGIFVLLAMAIVSIGWWAYLIEVEHLRLRAGQQLQAIGEFKARQIEDWLAERRRDIRILSASPSLRKDLGRWFANPDGRTRESLRTTLDSLRIDDNYLSIELLDRSGRSSLGVGTLQHDLTEVPLVDLAGISAAAEPFFIDLHRDGTNGDIHFSYVLAIRDEQARETIGYLRLSIDPHKHLYPLLQSWPTSSESAETLVVRKDGNDVLFLNDLRHRDGAALNLRLPLSREDLPAAAAIRRDRELFSGGDYRDIRVLAYLRTITGTPWAMVTKVDENEVFENTRRVALLSFLAVVVAVGFCGFILWQAWRRQQLRESLMTAEALRENREDLVRAQAVARTGSWRLDMQRNELRWSDEAYRIFGIPAGMPLTYELFLSTVHPEDRSYVDRMWQGALLGAPYDLVHRILVDGEVKWVRERAQLEFDGNGVLIGGFGSCQDVTELQAAQAALLSSEARLRVFVEYAPAALAMLDRNMGYLAVSRRWRSEYQLGDGDLLGESHIEAVPEIPSVWKQAHTRALAGEVVSSPGDRFDKADGTARWVRWEVRPWHDGAETIGGVVIFTEDITEQMAAMENAARLAAIVAWSDDAIIGMNLEGRLTSWNAGAERMYGFSAAEMIGQTPDRLLPADRANEEREFLERIRKGGVVSRVETIRLRKDGQALEVSTTVSPVRDEGGQIIGVSKITRDISAAKRAEAALLESKQRFAGIVESAMDGIISIDQEHRIVLFNAAAEAIFGFSAPQVLGTSIDRLIPPAFRACHAEHIRQFDQTGMTSRSMGRLGALLGVRSDGTEFPIEASISQITVGGRKLFTVILRDITERVRAQEEIHRLNADLERRVQERTAELAQSNEALMRSNLELQHFAHVAAHDLQTPLRSIAGFAQLLQKQYPTGKDDGANQWIAQVVDNTKRMQVLIQDLLNYSRLESQARPWVATDFRQLFDEVRRGLDSSIRETGADVTCGYLPALTVDRTQMAQVLQNLIENGMKYNTSQPPRIHLAAERRGEEWLFSVADNGIGVDPTYHQRIFEAFRRLHPYHDYPGTGIGLAVCQRVVERHGGRIWVDSQTGAGSTFYFTIPVEAAITQ